MQTNDLIEILAKDARATAPSPVMVLAGAAVVAIMVAAAVFFSVLGPRPDFALAMSTTRFALKFVVTGALVVTALALAARLARPGAGLGAMNWLLLAPLILLVAVLGEFRAIPSADWHTRWIGTNSLVCMMSIPLIGVGPLAVFLVAIRYGAPTRPRLAGAVAGLLAGGLAALFYAAHCPDDSPFFVATWYTIAIAGMAALGALAGQRLLRW
ncbi:MAG TPA: NrsF family protein [Mesorhizobium sp.]